MASTAGAMWASQISRTSCLRPGRVWCRMINANCVIARCCHQPPTQVRRRRRTWVPAAHADFVPSGRPRKPTLDRRVRGSSTAIT
ncbi:hypothetical protein NOCARDAX2BIS_460043 [Nocardioides sp. AX2bis]|nr:hypothetical protein NOCARDAX2BIS_460043 [Nocardioides sp. AX2bis]